MAALQQKRIIDDIRAFIYSSDQTRSEELDELARHYAQACRAANDRLNRCGDFLEKGLRTQAIGLAEAEPDLLDLLAVLNFPELDEWKDLAATYGLPTFQPLRLDVADGINQAYAQEKQVEKLLRRHRRLALAKA